MSLWSTSYTASEPPPPKGVKNAKWPFYAGFGSIGISKKVCYRVALCEKCQRQSCKAFTDLSIRAQIVGGGYPLKYKFCLWMNHPLARRRCILWHFNRCLLTGELTNCNNHLQQCSLNTETTLIFAPQLTYTAARSLCDSWATCFLWPSFSALLFTCEPQVLQGYGPVLKRSLYWSALCDRTTPNWHSSSKDYIWPASLAIYNLWLQLQLNVFPVWS